MHKFIIAAFTDSHTVQSVPRSVFIHTFSKLYIYFAKLLFDYLPYHFFVKRKVFLLLAKKYTSNKANFSATYKQAVPHLTPHGPTCSSACGKAGPALGKDSPAFLVMLIASI